MSELADTIAIVTGAATGIGAAISQRFANEGASVAVLYYRQAKLAREIVDSIVRSGGRANEFSADVRSRAQIDRVFAAIIEKFGVPGVLVNSAGIDAAGIPIADMKPERFEDVIRTNLFGRLNTIQALLKARGTKQTSARIINVNSVHEEIPRAGAAGYCASKGAQRNLTRCLSLELAREAVTVNNRRWRTGSSE